MLRGSIVALAMLAGLGAAQAAEEEDFEVKDASDLVMLCSADPASPTYTAAINFCHGFAVGAFQYYTTLEALSPDNKFVCITEPRVTRDQAIANFVAWVKPRTELHSKPAVDAFFAWLTATYPCPN
ncbi:MAG: Rap1a/Tai family immunity protein [Geminicoccaceae bacterium]